MHIAIFKASKKKIGIYDLIETRLVRRRIRMFISQGSDWAVCLMVSAHVQSAREMFDSKVLRFSPKFGIQITLLRASKTRVRCINDVLRGEISQGVFSYRETGCVQFLNKYHL